MSNNNKKQTQKDELNLLLASINDKLPAAKFGLHYAYNGVQLEYGIDSHGCIDTLTEFMSIPQMIQYLRAFRKGIDYTFQFGVKNG